MTSYEGFMVPLDCPYAHAEIKKTLHPFGIQCLDFAIVEADFDPRYALNGVGLNCTGSMQDILQSLQTGHQVILGDLGTALL